MAAESGAIEERFLADGIAVQDDFVAPQLLRELIECAAVRRHRGEFTPARVGAAGQARREPHIRGDSTAWIAGELGAAERSLLADFEALRLRLNGAGYLGLFDLETHYACYPPGAGYERHVDRPRGTRGREVSLVLYLNEHWDASAGGQLRFFEASGGHRDVDPLPARLVCFRSASWEHAVLPTRRRRLSIAGWFCTRQPA